MKTIELTQGKVAVIDDEDFNRVSHFKWFAVHKRNNWYACTSIPEGNIYLHQFILFTKNHTDHIDGDGLNNRRSNLREATSSQNNANRKPNIGKRFKGVHRQNGSRKFVAQIMKDRKHIYLGNYDSEEEAARAYDAKAKELFGPYARLNFPDV